jgi:uncharacterized Fe-S cluster protein YjdI
VFHAHGITTPPFSGGERAVAGEGSDTTYSVNPSCEHSYNCVRGPMRAGGADGDPELGVVGSQESKSEIIALITQKLEDCCEKRIIA